MAQAMPWGSSNPLALLEQLALQGPPMARPPIQATQPFQPVVQQTRGPAGGPVPAPMPAAGGEVNPFSEAFAGMQNPFTNPEARFGLPRGPEQNPMQNFGAGFVTDLVNTPMNAYDLYMNNVGRPWADWFNNTAEYLTTPEGEYAERQAAETAPAAPQGGGFQPGLPQRIQQTENGTGDPAARNPNSSAMGNGQFLRGTWLDFMNEVHPDMMGVMSESDALQLRADPRMSDEATSWYAGKAVDALDAINMPASDGNIYLHHFLGPGGMQSVLTGDPDELASSVLPEAAVRANQRVLEGKTLQEVRDWAAVQVGDYDSPGPTPRPQMQAPDFSEANRWFDQARPEPLDPATVANAQLAAMLQGIGEGLGSVNAEQEGGGALFGALARGAGKGNAAGQNLKLDLEHAFQQSMNAYAEGRGGIAQDQSTAQASVANENANRAHADANDAEAFRIAESNSNYARTVPTIIESSADGLWVQPAGGGAPEFLSTEAAASGGMDFDDIETLGKTFGLESEQVQQHKYNTMATTAGMNILTFQREIMKDILSGGLGPSVFGEAYDQAMEAAEGKLSGGLAADPELQQRELNNIVAGMLMAATQSEQNNDWLLQAAALGNPGAIMLVQNGSQTGE